MRLSVPHTMLVMVNLAAVYLAVGSFAFSSVLIERSRGRAIGVVFAILLASFLLNFLAQFQDWAKSFLVLGDGILSDRRSLFSRAISMVMSGY
jgi:hypothetical protein